MIKKDSGISLDEAMEVYLKEKSSKNLDSLMNAGRRLIHHFVRLYGSQRLHEDLFQAGYEGLLKALKRFNPQYGISFTTYAGSLISGEIRHFVRKEAAYYKPRVVAELQERANKVIEDQISSTGEIPSAELIASSLNLKAESVYEVMKTGLVPLDEIDLSKIANARHESFKLAIEDCILLEQALNKLSETQRKVIDMLFFRDMTQSQTAEKLGFNQRKVSRVMHKGLESLRKMMA